MDTMTDPVGSKISVALAILSLDNVPERVRQRMFDIIMDYTKPVTKEKSR